MPGGGGVTDGWPLPPHGEVNETFRIEALAQELCRLDGEHWTDLDEMGRDFWRERARAEVSGRRAPEPTPDPQR